MRSARWLPLLVLLALAPSCAHRPAPAADPPAVIIGTDTVWSGDVRVDGVVRVRKGATLTILPGTRVTFASRRFAPPADGHEGFIAPGILVEGRIVAEGTEESPILFTSAAAPPHPGSWDKILFLFSGGNRFSRCVFEGGRYAFHAHFSEISVSRCAFRENEEGVRLGSSRVVIEDSVFTRNEVRGINFRECRNVIRRNLVYGNGDGIFLHSRNAASVIRENAVYANRGFDLRLGDLHEEDVDAGGNWWGTGDESAVRARIYDGEDLAGLGRVRYAPFLPRPPVAGAEIRGVFVSHFTQIAGAEVRASLSIEEGFFAEDYAAAATTDGNGAFVLRVPPGRYFVAGRADSSAGALFAFPGKNPVSVALGETAEIGLPSVVLPPRAVPAADPGARPAVVARALLDGKPAAGVTIQASRPQAADFRGPGEASAVTDARGEAVLHLPPGKYMLSAKRRTAGPPLGMVDDGGLFGVYPHSPVTLAPGLSVSVEIPLYEKRGVFDAPEGAEAAGPTDAPPGSPLEGTATLSGGPAAGHIVFFYRAPETIGRPAARSSTVSDRGRFTVRSLPPGDYSAYLRRAVPGAPGGAEEERVGPVPVRSDGEAIVPPVLAFGGGH